MTLRKAYEIRRLIENEIKNLGHPWKAIPYVRDRYGFSDTEVMTAWYGTYPGKETYFFLDDLRTLPEELYAHVRPLLLGHLPVDEGDTLDAVLKALVEQGKEREAREICRIVGFVNNPFGWEI
jgi:hypothetical protein